MDKSNQKIADVLIKQKLISAAAIKGIKLNEGESIIHVLIQRDLIKEEEIAEALAIPKRSAEEHWTFARAWLHKQIEEEK